MTQDFYSTLEVSRSASPDEIKAAYRKMALKYHPDRNPNNKEAEDKFKAAASAYEVLSDPEKKQRYDQLGHANYQQMGGGRPGGFGGHGGMGMDDIFEQFGDIFGSMFTQGNAGGRQRSSRKGLEPKRGHDLTQEITISLKESYVGAQREMSYFRFLGCDTCKGKGAKPGTSVETCKTCHGAGQLNYRQGFFMYSQGCTSCNGEGFTIPSPCAGCKGQSRMQKLDKFTVNIPKGIYDEAELRIADKGDAGVYGGPTGSLYIKVKIQSDKNFKRVDNDLVCTVMLTYPQLVLGCQVEVENIDGTKENVRIPKACPVGERIIISGKGFENLRGGKKHGNFVIVTQCHIPKKSSTEAKELLTKYAEVAGQPEKSDGSILGFFKKFLG